MLRSCQKYASGFRNVIVVYPTPDVDTVKAVCDQFAFVRQHTFDEPADGHAAQNELKSSCDLFSDADFFLLIDADCVFTDPVTPEQFFMDGKCDLLFTHYDDPSAVWNGGRLPWKEITDAALGRECMYETMRRFPFMYPRWLFAGLRAHIEHLHGKSFHDYVHTAPSIGRAWHGYSEFCALGAFALLFHSEKFHGYNTANGGLKPQVVRQFWSHSGLTDAEREMLEEITAGWEKSIWPIETIDNPAG